MDPLKVKRKKARIKSNPSSKEFTGVGSTKYTGNKKSEQGPKTKPSGYGLRPDRADLTKSSYENTPFKNRDIDTLMSKRKKFAPEPVKDVQVTNKKGESKMIYKPGKYKN